MHLSDGVIGVGQCAAGYLTASGLIALGLRKTTQRDIPKVSLMGAAFFVSSLIHVKIGITSVHLTLAGLIGIILGWSAPLAFAAGLFFQYVMFAHGGITTLGLNISVFSIPALLTYALFRILIRRSVADKWLALIGGFLSGLTLLGAAFLVFLIILSQGWEFMSLASVFSISNIVLAGIEGLLSVLILRQLLKVRPELIKDV